MRRRLLVVLGALAAPMTMSCAESPPPARNPSAPAASSNAEPMPHEKVADMQVYDGQGKARACGAPARSCSEEQNLSQEQSDRCRLAGYRVVRCGCASYCTGNVMADKPHYDAQGNAKTCEPPQDGCTPPETSAAFQDGCTEAGHRFVHCGCEWLCTGKPKSVAPIE